MCTWRSIWGGIVLLFGAVLLGGSLLASPQHALGALADEPPTVTPMLTPWMDVSPEWVTISGPDFGLIPEAFTFTAHVGPDDVSTPLTYTWSATHLDTIVHTSLAISDSVSLHWPREALGEQTITVTVANFLGVVTATHTITIYGAICTAPACPKPGILICPSGLCPYGCGVACATPTATLELPRGVIYLPLIWVQPETRAMQRQ